MTTIRAVLFDNATAAGSAGPQATLAAGRLAAAQVLPSGPGVSSVAKAVVGKIFDLLDLGIGDIVVGAWRTRSALLDAARQTWANPGSSRRVTTASFGFPWQHEFDVDLVVNAATVATITLVVTVEAEISDVVAVVQGGRITTLTGGTAAISIMLGLKGPAESEIPLAHATRQFNIAHEVALPASGLPLIAEARAP